MGGFHQPVATPGAPVPGVVPLLDVLAGTGVDRVELTATLSGGRWHVEHAWTGHHPDLPQSTATETSGHGDNLVSLEAALGEIAEDAAAGNEEMVDDDPEEAA